MQAWETSAREAVRHTITAYTHAADRGRFDEVALLFAPDGVLEVHGIGGARVQGRDAIRAFFLSVAADVGAGAAGDGAAVGRMQHHVAQVWIDLSSRREAHASCYFTVMTAAGVDHWGRYRDMLVAARDRWLFAHRQVYTDGVTPGGWADGRRRR